MAAATKYFPYSSSLAFLSATKLTFCVQYILFFMIQYCTHHVSTWISSKSQVSPSRSKSIISYSAHNKSVSKYPIAIRPSRVYSISYKESEYKHHELYGRQLVSRVLESTDEERPNQEVRLDF